MDRRLFFSGIAGGILFLLGWASLSWAATVSIPNTAVKTGTATIQVNQADGISGFQFALVFDPTVTKSEKIE